MNKHRELPEIAVYFIQSEPRLQNSAGAQCVAQGSECFDPEMRVGKLHAGQVKQEQSMRSGFPLIKKIKAQDSWSAIQSTRGESRVAGLCPQARPVNGDINIEPATTVNNPENPNPPPSGNDDDVVAKQIREAALHERDPELREKLWEEYRKYKAQIGR